MAGEILATYTPQLTMAFSTYGVQAISDQCLAEGLITEDTYKRVLDSAENESKFKITKSKILLRALQTCVNGDESCFDSVLNVLRVLGSKDKLVLDIEDEYLKLTIPQSKRCKIEESPTDHTTESEPDEYFIDAQVPEIRVLQKFTPELVIAVSSCGVLKVLDQFLAKEIITDGVYKRILESARSDDDKVRILLSAVKDTIRIDSSCFKTTLNILKEFPLSSKLTLGIDSEYQKFISQDSLRGKCVTGKDQTRLRDRHLPVSPEIRVIQKFTPELICAIRSNILEVSDECLARGLISNSKYNELLEIVCSENIVRILLQTLKDNTIRDKRCFEIFLGALSKKMPQASRSLLSSIKDEHHRLISMSSAAPTLELLEESDKLSEQNVFDKLEEAIKKSVQANAEKERLENELDLKRKELKKLKAAMETAEGHNREKDEEIERLKKKFSACKTEIDVLEDKIKKQQKTIEDYQMNVKREGTIAREDYKKVIDALRAATEVKKELSEEIEELKVKIDKLQQEKNDLREKKMGELQSSIDRLDQTLASSRLFLIGAPRPLLENLLENQL